VGNAGVLGGSGAAWALQPRAGDRCLWQEHWKRTWVLAEGRVGVRAGCQGQAEGSWLCRDVKAELLHVLQCPLSCPAKRAGWHLQVESALPESPGLVGRCGDSTGMKPSRRADGGVTQNHRITDW